MAQGIFLLLLLVAACQGDKEQALDLLAYGVPLQISLPDTVDIKKRDWTIQKDITLLNEEAGVNLQIFATEASDRNMHNRILVEKELVKESTYFKSFVQEDEHGFIYALQIDSSQSYDFRHLKLVGDQEILFRTGLFGTFNLEQVQDMYNRSVAAN